MKSANCDIIQKAFTEQATHATLDELDTIFYKDMEGKGQKNMLMEKAFCTHDWYLFGVLKRHSKFIRKSSIAKNGTVCHDTIEKVK